MVVQFWWRSESQRKVNGCYLCPSSTLGSTSASATQRPISSRGSSSCSSPPSPQPPPPWPSQWPWSQARWLFPPCRAGCRPTTAMPRPTAAGPDSSRCGSRRCGGGERKGSCWRRGEGHSHSSRGFLVEQQQRQISARVQTKQWRSTGFEMLDKRKESVPSLLRNTRDDFWQPDSVMCVAVVWRLTKVLNLRWCRLFPSRARMARLCRGARASPSIREMLLLLRLSTCADGQKIREAEGQVEETHTTVFASHASKPGNRSRLPCCTTDSLLLCR